MAMMGREGLLSLSANGVSNIYFALLGEKQAKYEVEIQGDTLGGKKYN